MEGRMFRFLRADEIDCRIGAIKDNGLTLLLYKDARCDMNILDETFGPLGWQRHHTRDNANCIVSVYDLEKGEWIEKEDTGTESNTEAEKGLASDSFKRACFNWGIGRELYTAPFIWISSDNCEIRNKKCYDKFRVVDIGYDENGVIKHLIISNDTKGIDVYRYPRLKSFGEPKKPTATEAPDGYFYCAKCGNEIKEIKMADGTVISQREVAERTFSKYGRQLCLACSKNEGKID